MKISIALTLLVAATTTSALPLFVHGPNDILPTTNPESAVRSQDPSPSHLLTHSPLVPQHQALHRPAIPTRPRRHAHHIRTPLRHIDSRGTATQLRDRRQGDTLISRRCEERAAHQEYRHGERVTGVANAVNIRKLETNFARKGSHAIKNLIIVHLLYVLCFSSPHTHRLI